MNGGPTSVRAKGKHRMGEKTHSVWFSWTGLGTDLCRVKQLKLSEDRQKLTPGEGMSHKHEVGGKECGSPSILQRGPAD